MILNTGNSMISLAVTCGSMTLMLFIFFVYSNSSKYSTIYSSGRNISTGKPSAYNFSLMFSRSRINLLASGSFFKCGGNFLRYRTSPLVYSNLTPFTSDGKSVPITTCVHLMTSLSTMFTTLALIGGCLMDFTP